MRHHHCLWSEIFYFDFWGFYSAALNLGWNVFKLRCNAKGLCAFPADFWAIHWHFRSRGFGRRMIFITKIIDVGIGFAFGDITGMRERVDVKPVVSKRNRTNCTIILFSWVKSDQISFNLGTMIYNCFLIILILFIFLQLFLFFVSW